MDLAGISLIMQGRYLIEHRKARSDEQAARAAGKCRQHVGRPRAEVIADTIADRDLVLDGGLRREISQRQDAGIGLP
ncbi:hypothetical protein D3C87_1301610 [compost metagenome]